MMIPIELLASLALWLALAEQASAQTVSCMSGHEWMNNQKGQSPCMVARWIISDSAEAAGENVNPDVGPINSSGQYDSLGSSGTISDARTCSWTFYNAMQACAFCQGGRSQNWTAWSSASCQSAGHVSNDSYWPTEIAVNRNTAYPQYMIYNPQNWLNGLFDVPTAQRIASQNLPDVTDASAPQPDPAAGSSLPPPSVNDSPKGPSAGVLAGAIVGGILGLTALAALIWWLAFIRPRDKQIHKRRKHVDLDDEKGLPPPTPDGIIGAKIEPFSFEGHVAQGGMQSMPMGQPGMVYQNMPGMSPAIYSPLARNSPPLPNANFSPSHTPPPGPRPAMMTTTSVRHSNASLTNLVPNPRIDEKRRMRDQGPNPADSFSRTSSVPSIAPYAFNIPTHGMTYDNKPGDSSSQKPSPQDDNAIPKPTKADEKGKGKLDVTLYPTNLGSDVVSDSSHGNDNDPEALAVDGANANVIQSLSTYKPTQWTAASVDAFISANPGARVATGRDREMPPPTY